MFASFTNASNAVMYNGNYRCLFRGLTLGPAVAEVPEMIPVNRVISLTLHENTSLKTLEHYSELRSLKLIGKTNWILSIIKSISPINIKLDQLAIITPAVKSLSEILMVVLFICSLRRLEIHTEDYAGSVEVCHLSTKINNIEQFILDSSSTIHWNELSHVLACLIQSRYLNISLIDRHPLTLPSLFLHNLRTLSIRLLEPPFDYIIQLVTIAPCLKKLKITGLVDADGFVLNQRWIRFFETALSLSRIFVNVSLERNDESYHSEEIQAPLRALNLSLECDYDDTDYAMYYGTVERWWSLKGLIIRQTRCI